MVGGDADGLRARGERARALCARGHADGRRRAAASSRRWSTRSASRASCRRLPKASTSRCAPGSTRARARRDQQGRRAIVADGEPRQDDGRRQVRLRLRGRLDAQGPRDLPRRSAAQRRDAAGHRARRPVLRAGAGARRRPLGHVEPHPAAARSASERRAVALARRRAWPCSARSRSRTARSQARRTRWMRPASAGAAGRDGLRRHRIDASRSMLVAARSRRSRKVRNSCSSSRRAAIRTSTRS